MVRNIGSVEGNRPASDNDWEAVKSGGDPAIKRWITGQLSGKSCAVVLIGANTANRKWINHEIVQAWDNGLGVAGIYNHGLKDANGDTSSMGHNPFDYITHGKTRYKLSSIVKACSPVGLTSQNCYAWISDNLSSIVEEAITIRGKN